MKIKSYSLAGLAILMFSLALVGMSLLGGSLLTYAVFQNSNSEATSFESVAPTIEAVVSLGELVVVQVSVSDVLVGKSRDYEGSWLIKGDALVSVDMREARLVEANEEEKRLKIELPIPVVVQPRVDHEKTKTWEVRKTSWVPFRGDPDDLRDDAMRQAQVAISQMLQSDSKSELAKANAERIVESLYRHVDWAVEIEWRKNDQLQNQLVCSENNSVVE